MDIGELFKLFDKRNRGKIYFEDLKRVASEMGDEKISDDDVRRMISRAKEEKARIDSLKASGNWNPEAEKQNSGGSSGGGGKKGKKNRRMNFDNPNGADNARREYLMKQQEKKDKFFGGEESVKPKKKRENYYKLLDLDKTEVYTEEQIRKQYHRTSLKYHPDKNPGDLQAAEYYKKITNAYETLSDDSKRALYDSSIIPETVIYPSMDDAEDNFYGTYTKCFDKYARWSETQPVPSFGDSSTSIEDVDVFYKFWYEFHSTRAFNHLDEDDDRNRADGMEMGRDQRRAQTKENKKRREEKKRNEHRSIRELVDLAFKSDPRVVTAQQKEREEKEMKRRANSPTRDRPTSSTTEENIHENPPDVESLQGKGAKWQGQRNRLRSCIARSGLEDMNTDRDDMLDAFCANANVQALKDLSAKLELVKGEKEVRAELRKLIPDITVKKQVKAKLLRLLDEVDNPAPKKSAPVQESKKKKKKVKPANKPKEKMVVKAVTPLGASSEESEEEEEVEDPVDIIVSHHRPVQEVQAPTQKTNMPQQQQQQQQKQKQQQKQQPQQKQQQQQTRRPPVPAPKGPSAETLDLQRQIQQVRAQIEAAKAIDDFEACISLKKSLQSLESALASAGSNASNDADRSRVNSKLDYLLKKQQEASDKLGFGGSVQQQQELDRLDQIQKIVEQKKAARKQELIKDQSKNAEALEQLSDSYRQNLSEFVSMSSLLGNITKLENQNSISKEHLALEQRVGNSLSDLNNLSNHPFLQDRPFATDVNDEVASDIQYLSTLLA